MTPRPPVPPPFQPMFAGLLEVSQSGPGEWFHQCFGCGPEHEIGTRVRCFRGDGEVLSPIVVPARFQGPPGAVQGGIVAVYLDEVLAGAALDHSGRTYVTGELTVRYVKPTPIERPLLGRGRATKDAGKYLDLEATLEELETGQVVARATARFFPVKGSEAKPSAADG
jgi:acyl-coenzyme A thioesterase PaaI-like protein